MIFVCSKCLGNGWQDVTLAGLSQVRVVGKDGSYLQVQCDKCNGTGQIEIEDVPRLS